MIIYAQNLKNLLCKIKVEMFLVTTNPVIFKIKGNENYIYLYGLELKGCRNLCFFNIMFLNNI